MNELVLSNKIKEIEKNILGASGSNDEILQIAKKRIYEYEKIDKAKEYQFSVGDKYSKKLFVAIARRYGLRPYRLKRQKHTTVMLKVSKRFVDDILWPEFMILCSELDFYLEHVANEIIRLSVFENFEEDNINNV